MTADKARNMLLEEKRRRKTQVQVEPMIGAAVRSPGKRHSNRKALEASGQDGPCTECEKPHNEKACWKLHHKLAPEWLQEKWTVEKKIRKREYEEEGETW